MTGTPPPPLHWIRALADGLLAAIAAPACAACDVPLDHPLDGPVCERCWTGIRPFPHPLCRRCGESLVSWRSAGAGADCPRCRDGRSAISVARAIGSYDDPLRAIVQALKYGHRRTVAGPLGARLRLAAGDALHRADVAVPVPLHRRKQRQRGFNQADDLARHLGVPVVRALVRHRHTPSQTDLPAPLRRANVRGAFRMTRRAAVRGLIVVLVDDVATTGATLEACAAVLRDAGARDVRAVTAARVPTSPR